MRIRLVATLVLVAAVSGCSAVVTKIAPGRNVVHAGNVELARAERVANCTGVHDVNYRDPSVVRVYFDRMGDLYPGLMVDHGLRQSDVQGSQPTLKKSFDQGPERDAYARWTAIAEELGVDRGAPGAWAEVQTEIRRRHADAIDRAIRDAGGDGPLVVFVHGFNVDAPECVYAATRARIEQEVGAEVENAVYLYVAWDGLRARTPGQLYIWSKAQYNFPLVGRGLRRLLNELESPERLDVRVITHSSGGPVAAHTFWDGSGAESIDKDECVNEVYGEYLRDRVNGTHSSPPPFRDVRLGMIVPATPESIFRQFDPASTPVSRVVIGANPRDFATQKGPRSCVDGGNTCLASRPAYACQALARFDDLDGVDLRLFDLRGGPTELGLFGYRWEAHDFELYLERRDFARIVKAVFTDEPVLDEAATYCSDVHLSWTLPRRSPAEAVERIETACSRHWREDGLALH